MKKKAYHHGNLEEALLKVGMKEAKATGPRNLGVTHLARLVNVTPMAIYRHFPNGENLKAAISQQAREELARRGREYIKFGLDEPGLLAVAFLDCDELPSREDNPSARNILHDAILDLCNEGIVTANDVEAIAHFAWSTVHGFTMLASSADLFRPGSDAAEIEDILERAWLGVTQYSKE
jgi:AcrR family transcriptional regulator